MDSTPSSRELAKLAHGCHLAEAQQFLKQVRWRAFTKQCAKNKKIRFKSIT